jgi:hypothetical protein
VILSPLHDELLSRLEQSELALLAWGMVDGTLTDDEVRTSAADVAGSDDQGDQLITDLTDWHLLIDVGDRDVLYRTRFAESVRLLARNRQLLHGQPWRTAAELVNDFRVVARPRRFPKRDESLASVVQQLGHQRGLDAVEEQALRAMLTTDRGELRLARFQLEATEHIRARLADGSTAATMVCAGTGSGKTKAFYLPVLASVAADAATDDSRWARVIAIYPRNELLKDQLVEAVAQADAIAAAGGPVLAIGAYFGPTAYATKRVGDSSGWTAVDGGHACRYLRCPRGCIADVVWSDEHRLAGREIVRCPRCAWTSRDGQVVLTRDTMQHAPPHVLFTSTEMLNRVLAESRTRPLVIGTSAQRRPRTVLLDEVHSYSGVHGAQVALLLRRWRHALALTAPLHVVGLSATLEAPERFFADLTGISEVRVIRPAEQDLEDRGAEYALVLRGNPVSGTALLSTTIQTTFLLARLLEARNLRDRTGTSGSRVFAFTDNLDVTNRLFWDLRDAESGGRRRNGPLAMLRSDQASETAARDLEGQVWRLPPVLGRQLDAQSRLKVTRTSSQDAGVDLTADVIVATSSLEVGFDDPEVGAVVQHKAPRDDAAFLQRKGRAGRLTDMRPWTIVVLSDYGRDRLRYQAYETLFAPSLAPRTLPVDNLHVLKMQAAYVLLDWLAEQVHYLNARTDLSGRSGAVGDVRHRRQIEVAGHLAQVLGDPRAERELEHRVRRALGLTDAQTQSVMWEPPRALMTSAIPTLMRRLETRWSTVNGGDDLSVDDVPLPEHAPRALFSNLNLPEVEVVAPRRGDREARFESMSVPQALNEFVPGRSSRRFGVESRVAWHWVPRPAPDEDGVRRSNVNAWMTRHQSVGSLDLPGEGSRRVLRPWRMELELTPSIDDRASARPVWASSLKPCGDSWDVEVPVSAPLHDLVPSLAFHTHGLGNEVHVLRAVTHVVAETDEAIEADIELVDGTGPSANRVALGFAADVDAARVHVRISALRAPSALPPAAHRALRTSWFDETVVADSGLRSHASHFSLGWLSVLYLASLAAVAIGESRPDLRSTVNRVRELGTSNCLRRALEGVFAVSLGDEDDDGQGVRRIRDLVEDDTVAACLDAIVDLLVDGDASLLETHGRAAGAATIAVAVREAFQRLAPTFDAESLVIDLVDREDGEVDIWLCEPDVGSGGTVEELRRRVAEEPSRFARLVASSLRPTDLEVVDTEVRSALSRVDTDQRLADAFAATRSAVGTKAGREAQDGLRAALRANGITVEHGVLATLNLRVLRPGSSRRTDKALVAAFALWEEVEDRLGLELDARAIAYAVSRGGPLTLEQTYSLLWPRGRGARGAGTNRYSRYGSLPTADRLLLSGALEAQVDEVSVGPDAEAEVVEILARSGIVRLVATADQTTELQRLVRSLLTRAVDVASVTGYARIVGAGRRGRSCHVDLELPEAAI